MLILNKNVGGTIRLIHNGKDLGTIIVKEVHRRSVQLALDIDDSVLVGGERGDGTAPEPGRTPLRGGRKQQ